MNCIILTVVFFLVTGIVIFTFLRNQKDKREFEIKVNNDYPKRKKERYTEAEV